ncbi:hypothetical protein, partial [Lactobacillus taiwanensis]|uniref:hypothetical protein n=1 Tax=Lactobacillus taiwanensis TaxID=508451 RepID=UPI000BCF311B
IKVRLKYLKKIIQIINPKLNTLTTLVMKEIGLYLLYSGEISTQRRFVAYSRSGIVRNLKTQFVI